MYETLKNDTSTYLRGSF